MDSPDQKGPDIFKSELELKKLEKEISKLEQEIKEKQLSWVRKNLAVLIPSFIAVLTLLIGFFTGYFNVENVRLENKRYELAREVRIFTREKDTLNIRLRQLYNRLDSLSRVYNSVTIEYDRSKRELKGAQTEIASLRKSPEFQNSIFKRLRDEKDSTIKECYKQLNEAVNKQYALQAKADGFDNLNYWVLQDIRNSGDAVDGSMYLKRQIKVARDSLLICREALRKHKIRGYD